MEISNNHINILRYFPKHQEILQYFNKISVAHTFYILIICLTCTIQAPLQLARWMKLAEFSQKNGKIWGIFLKFQLNDTHQTVLILGTTNTPNFSGFSMVTSNFVPYLKPPYPPFKPLATKFRPQLPLLLYGFECETLHTSRPTS